MFNVTLTEVVFSAVSVYKEKVSSLDQMTVTFAKTHLLQC